MSTPKTHLRVTKARKDQLNDLAAKAGYSSELLADLLLGDALEQIADELTPTEILPHVAIIRKRLGKRMETMQAVAIVDRWLVSQGKPPMADTLTAPAQPHVVMAASDPPRRHAKR